MLLELLQYLQRNKNTNRHHFPLIRKPANTEHVQARTWRNLIMRGECKMQRLLSSSRVFLKNFQIKSLDDLKISLLGKCSKELNIKS